MTKKRGFEIISDFKDQNLNLPKRATKHAAGYDFEAAEDIEIPSIWHQVLSQIPVLLKESVSIKGAKSIKKGTNKKINEANDNLVTAMTPTLVPTGIKAYMGDDEYLQLANRSGNPIKEFLHLANGIGVIDKDYYNNDSNEGHIMFQFINWGLGTKTIKKGDRIGQGVFIPFLKADNDSSSAERKGGFGSTKK